MKCRRCGADINRQAKFCRKCGQAVSESSASSVNAPVNQQTSSTAGESIPSQQGGATAFPKFCRKCGSKLLDNPKFCTRCGTVVTGIGETDDSTQAAIGSRSSADSGVVADTSSPQSVPQTRPEEQCRECGNKLLPNAKFCTKCGTPVSKENGSSSRVVVQQEPEAVSSERTNISTPRSQQVDQCKRCGSELKPNAKFCTKCGAAHFKPVDESTSVLHGKKSIVTVEKGEVEPEQIYGKPRDTCFQCGEKLPVKSPNCTNCGAKRVTCPVCKRNVNHSETVGACPFCQNQFHFAHLRETVKVTGKCPMCKSPLKQHEIEEKKQVSPAEIKT